MTKSYLTVKRKRKMKKSHLTLQSTCKINVRQFYKKRDRNLHKLDFIKQNFSNTKKWDSKMTIGFIRQTYRVISTKNKGLKKRSVDFFHNKSIFNRHLKIWCYILDDKKMTSKTLRVIYFLIILVTCSNY